MEDSQLRLSQFIVDEIVEKLERLTRYCKTTNTISGVLSLTEQECLNNLATINVLEKKLAEAYAPTQAELGELKDSLLAARKNYEARQNQVVMTEIVPERKDKTEKPQRTPPTPTYTASKVRKAIEIPAPERNPESSPAESTRSVTNGTVTGQPSKTQTRQRSFSCSRPAEKVPSAKDIDDMLRFMSENTPTISIPRCDNLVSTVASLGVITTAQRALVEPIRRSAEQEIVITRWDKNGCPITDGQSPIYSMADMSKSAVAPLMPPPSLPIWKQDFGTYVSPAARGQNPQVFDLRQKLSRPATLGRGRALTVGSSWTDSTDQVADRDRWALRARVDTIVPLDSDMTTPYPASYLSAFGGVPPLYSVNLARKDTEWPVYVFVKITGFDWRGAYIDRHALTSVIGEETIPKGASRNDTLSRLHVDLPWRGRGEPFFIDQAVTVPITFDNTDLQLRQSFGVVKALKNAIILGQDFTLKNGVYYEVAENQNIKVHIRHTWTKGRRAQRAWQIPDGKGSFQPRKSLTHDGHSGSV